MRGLVVVFLHIMTALKKKNKNMDVELWRFLLFHWNFQHGDLGLKLNANKYGYLFS